MHLNRPEGSRRVSLRELLRTKPAPLFGGWGATAHHAQITEITGFDFFGVSGSNTSTHLLGLPDAGFLTLSEMVENTRRICGAISIPVIVDCDTGFGNAINVLRTTEEMILAGASCLFIEDQVAPKRCGFVKGKELISLDEATGKIRAACDVRDRLNPEFMIMTRTDARGAVGGGMEEVLRRGKAYQAAGSDILYFEALQSRDEIMAVRHAFPDAYLEITPWAVNPPISSKETVDLGITFTSVHVGRIGAIAMYDFMKQYRARGEDAYNEVVAQTRDHPLGGFRIFDMTGFPKVLEWEREFLPAETMDKYENSLGIYDPRAAAAGKTSKGG
jgi:2-methylisocitrate lyase-like PEP mutase family enzyme